ncbi:hypothetical protein Tco_0060420, partial [Tanacetum coccineum]
DVGLPSEKVVASGKNGDDGDLLLFRDDFSLKVIDHLDVAMHIAENHIVHTFELILYDVHRMLEMCLCDVAHKVVRGMWFHRIVVMGIWFHRTVVMGNGYNFEKCCHTVDVGCRMMVVVS